MLDLLSKPPRPCLPVDVVHLYAYITCRARTVEYIEFYVLSPAERIAVLVNANTEISFAILLKAVKPAWKASSLPASSTSKSEAKGMSRSADTKIALGSVPGVVDTA